MKSYARILLLTGLCIVAGCATTDGDTPEVIVEDLVVGTGQEVQEGDTLDFHYEARLFDGTLFDSSRDRDAPARLILGVGLILDEQEPAPVIDGLNQGIPGMRPGGIRRLTIPPELAYGRSGVECTGTECLVPPDATLIYEIELLAVNP